MGIGKGRVRIIPETVPELSGQACDPSSARIPKTVGQLSRDTEIVVQIPKWQESLGVEAVFLPAKATAAEGDTKMRSLGSAALGRNVDNTAQRISTKDRCRPGKDFHSLDVLDGDQVEVDGVEVRLVNSYAVDNNDRCCNRLAVKTPHIDLDWKSLPT